MNQKFKDILLNATKAKQAKEKELIQNLWSGYGKIIRFELNGTNRQSIVVKHVRLPEAGKHPRGWNTNLSHQRKLKSYKVETNWYKKWASQCDDNCRIPECLAIETEGEEVLMVLEDLDESGFSNRKNDVSWTELKACLKWLAYFHARFMNHKPEGLWDIGTYWHLDTRPDELNELNDKELKNYAHLIDKKLNQSPFQTFVHGDAKIANFCFNKGGDKVAAVDFQYIGGGCGMKDVAYFVGSCLYEEDCERLEEQVLEYYFKELKKALSTYKVKIDFDSLEANWRDLYPYAWTDFHRFLKGWSPGHWKINSYSERMTRQVIGELKSLN